MAETKEAVADKTSEMKDAAANKMAEAKDSQTLLKKSSTKTALSLLKPIQATWLHVT